jgi:hypothetical protein
MRKPEKTLDLARDAAEALRSARWAIVSGVPGGYVARDLRLEGCVGTGATKEEALAELHAAADDWLRAAKRAGRIDRAH